jgi:hypothetical protein
MPRGIRLRPQVPRSIPTTTPGLIGRTVERSVNVNNGLLAIGVSGAARSTTRIFQWAETSHLFRALQANNDVAELNEVLNRMREHPGYVFLRNAQEIFGVFLTATGGIMFFVTYGTGLFTTVKVFFQDIHGNLLEYANEFRYENGETL